MDLSGHDRLVSPEPYGPSAEAVRCGLWLAKESGANVTFHYSLDAAAATERLIAEHRGDRPNIFDEATDAMRALAGRAKPPESAATSKVTMGVSWRQLIRQAISGRHDLVLVGTRDSGPLQRVLIGSTAMKLLRKCPCPVWVTKPRAPDTPHAILVATI